MGGKVNEKNRKRKETEGKKGWGEGKKGPQGGPKDAQGGSRDGPRMPQGARPGGPTRPQKLPRSSKMALGEKSLKMIGNLYIFYGFSYQTFEMMLHI
jgi:hypothetical protein